MVARCLTFLFTAVVIVHSQEIAEWESWLTQSGLSQAKYENLIGETASSLNMSNQELHDSLVSNAASVQNDPVSLLIQLRDELQIVTDLDGLEVANENEDEDDTMQYAHGQEEAALNEDDVGETALEPSSHYKEDDEVLQELDRLLDAGLGLNETVYGQERKGVWDSIEEEQVQVESGDTQEHVEESSRMPPDLSHAAPKSILDEVIQQVRSDLTRVKAALDLVLPEPLRIVAAQAFTQVSIIAEHLRVGFVTKAIPKLRTLVLDEGSPGRLLASKISCEVALAAKRVFEMARKTIARFQKPGREEAEEADGGHEQDSATVHEPGGDIISQEDTGGIFSPS
mmetsp:Transcript_7700/g.14190  ORF Transcript_7700/g.14190 Transcript_7700/m.14190 type:complete len:341 (+) Transcript_7700:76-1098(+)